MKNPSSKNLTRIQPAKPTHTKAKRNNGNAKDLLNKYIFEYSFFDLVRDGITCYYMQLNTHTHTHKEKHNELNPTAVREAPRTLSRTHQSVGSDTHDTLTNTQSHTFYAKLSLSLFLLIKNRVARRRNITY